MSTEDEDRRFGQPHYGHEGAEEHETMQPDEVYLGDAVYASYDGFQLRLRTGDGNNQVIYLEPAVMRALEVYARRTLWSAG